jgi:primary-amine oxidase
MEQVPVSLPLSRGKGTSPQHPLGPLTPAEISESASLIKGLWPTNTNIQFKTITLHEPSKEELTPYLGAERVGQQTLVLERKSFVVYYIRNTVSMSTSSSFKIINMDKTVANVVTGKTP